MRVFLLKKLSRTRRAWETAGWASPHDEVHYKRLESVAVCNLQGDMVVEYFCIGIAFVLAAFFTDNPVMELGLSGGALTDTALALSLVLQLGVEYVSDFVSLVVEFHIGLGPAMSEYWERRDWGMVRINVLASVLAMVFTLISRRSTSLSG